MDIPSKQVLENLADELRLGIPAEDVDGYHAMASGLLGSWAVVDALYEQEIAPSALSREWSEPATNSLGAWYVTTEIAIREDGPLAGRRVAVKDNVAVGGVPMMNGSEMVRGFVPKSDATVVARLLDAGATIAGKSVCEDLCFSGASHTSKSGPVRNPWNHDRTAGGSSSGSAALVAAGQVDFAIGGDQGGSVRIPASFCGVVGHKPTFGLVPYTGAFPIEQSIDHLGPIARTVADAAALLTIIAGPDGQDPRQPADIAGEDYVTSLQQLDRGLRIGVVSEGFAQANSEQAVTGVVRQAIESLTAAGHFAEEVSIPWHMHGAALWDVISVEGATYQMLQGNAYGLNWKGTYDPELMAFFGQKWRQDPSSFSETVKLVALGGTYALRKGYGASYAKARNLESALSAAYDSALSRYDVLVMPTTPITASLLPSSDAPVDEALGRALEMLSNTAPFDVTGHPACSIPAGLADGLPVGLMVVGKKYEDASVLRAAHAFEHTLGTLTAPSYQKEFTA
ncbi:amidase [Paenarthrobacter nitroguajacolicus]|uniref:amidase n=1 Tax=Paenarthrobacter nitroguajacolicus TaxID=211146 RepID=UPI00248B36FB|nr:amidase [Paenarthrobacter nitroguajacolicus]MDI2037253.1 Amidase [Paenarthrobacter nitroguajacolicus]